MLVPRRFSQCTCSKSYCLHCPYSLRTEIMAFADNLLDWLKESLSQFPLPVREAKFEGERRKSRYSFEFFSFYNNEYSLLRLWLTIGFFFLIVARVFALGLQRQVSFVHLAQVRVTIALA